MAPYRDERRRGDWDDGGYTRGSSRSSRDDGRRYSSYESSSRRREHSDRWRDEEDRRRDDDDYRRRRDDRRRRGDEVPGYYNRGLRDNGGEDSSRRRRRRDEEDDDNDSDRRRRCEETEDAPPAPRRPRRSGFSSAPPPGTPPVVAPGGDVVAAAAQMGLVPIVPDAATKPRRELFVGNTPPQTTERMLIDHLNAAMSTMRMNSAPGAPVVQCRVSANFAFVELRTIEETDRALSLTGIPFMGHVLKIGRPSKYDGPVTPASTWQQLLVEGGFDRDGAPSGFPHEAAAALSMSPGDPASEKVCRELFIGNTSALMTESSIRAFLGLVARQLGQVIGPGDPIISLRLSGHFAFVELRSVEETDAMLQFNGIPFQGSQLRIGRPSKYAGPQHRASEEPRWIDVLDKYRKGDLQPLEIRGAAAVMEPPPLARADVDDLEKLTLDPHRTIVLRRILEETDPEDIPDNEDDARRRRTAVVDGILDEVQRECAKYGTVVSATPDGDDLLVRFSLVDHAILALATLRHRLFDGRKLRVEFVPESPALPPPTPGDHNHDVNPPPPPPPPENYSDFAHYGLL